jgi:hypothetical protein
MIRLEHRRQHLAQPLPTFALDEDEAPGSQLSMIRHAGRDLQKGLDLLLARTRLPEPARGNGTALLQAGKAFIHGIFIQLE